MRSYVRAYTQCLVAMSTLLLALRADLTHAQTGQPQVTPEAKLHLNELINWVHSNGGYVGEGVAFGYENSIRGLVAGSKGFKMGDIIMDISNAAIMLPTQKVDNPAEYDQCAQIARVHDELNKGEESHWWEYLRIDDSLGVRTIALWDDSVLDQLQGLPPYQHRFSVDWYVYECKENANKDVVLLQSLKANIENISDWKPATMLDSDSKHPHVLLSDSVSAVEYRLQFKRAVRTALSFGTMLLKQRNPVSADTESIQSGNQQVAPIKNDNRVQHGLEGGHSSAVASGTSNGLEGTPETQLDELIDWVEESGGYVAEGVAFGYENSIRGLVAGSKGFKAGELIMDIPNSVVIRDKLCDRFDRLHKELNKGEASHWWKYLRMDDSRGVRTTALWDDSVLDELQNLPPYTPRFGLQWYAHWCENGKKNASGASIETHSSVLDWYHQKLSKKEKHALWIILTRSSGFGVVPIWDLCNHHNGLHNIVPENHEDGIRFKALVDIAPGGTIHNSYGESVPSDQMLRNYGFVEAWPQIWSWCSANCKGVDGRDESETRHRFVLFPAGVVAIESDSGDTVCSECHNLASYQTAAREHTQSLDNLIMEGFVSAARVLLEGLPTSVDEDVAMLESLNAEIGRTPDWKAATMLAQDNNSENVRLTDTLAVVEYRLQFKQAVHTALQVGVDELDRRQNEL